MTKRKTNAELAREIWDSAQPISGTLVEIYLGSRGITLPDPAPDCLRFAPKLTHSNGQFFPAMIALPTNPKTGEPIGGIQRTFLSWTGKGKAQVEKNEQKMSLGPTKGGVVRLAEPTEGKPLILGEGVETVLTVMEATGLPGWATLGTSGLVNLDCPTPSPKSSCLAENDGGPNEKALKEVLPALIARGVKARVARPPKGLKDFNDLVNGTSGHAPEAGREVVRQAVEAAAKSRAEIEREAEGDPEDEDAQFSLTETGLWARGKNNKWKRIAQSFDILGLRPRRGGRPRPHRRLGQAHPLQERRRRRDRAPGPADLSARRRWRPGQFARLLGHGHHLHADGAPPVRASSLLLSR